MIKGAIIFAVAAAVLALLGFGGLAGAAWDIAKILFWIALVIAVLLFVLGVTVYKKVTRARSGRPEHPLRPRSRARPMRS